MKNGNDSRTPRRRWFQVYLAASLLLIAVISLGAGWWVFEVRQARRREAIAAIEKLHGHVGFDDSHAFRAGWFGAVLSDDIGVQAVAIHLGDASFDDAELTAVARFGELRCLYLHETSVSDVGLVHLSHLKYLQRLGLRSTRVTDTGLVNLACLKKLECLDLEHTQVSDAGLTQLTGLKNLEELNLRRTQVTDAGVASLQRMLPNTRIYH